MAFLPFSLFACLLASSAYHDYPLSFGRLDYAVSGIMLLGVSLCVYHRSHKNLLTRLLLLYYSMLLAGVTFELGLRILFRQPDTPWQPNTVREITLRVPLSGVAASGTFSVNRLGVRGDLFDFNDVADANDSVLCIGGSTTECFYNTDETSWPWHLGTLLTDYCGTFVPVGNAGRGGHVAKHHLYQLRNFQYASSFKYITVLCGWNDLSAALYSEPSAPPRDFQREALLPGMNFSDTAQIPHVAFYRRTACVRLLERVLLRRQTDPMNYVGWRAVVQDEYGTWVAERRRIRMAAVSAGVVEVAPLNLRAAIESFRSDLQEITKAVRPGQKLIFLTQPTLCRKDMESELEARLWSSDGRRAFSPEITAEMLEQFNDITRSVCLENQLICIDLSESLSGNAEMFYDDCHFTDKGCRVVASLVADAIKREIAADGK